MGRTLSGKPGGLGSGTTLALTRSDLKEATLPWFSHLENEEVIEVMIETPSSPISVELSGTQFHQETSDGRNSPSQSHLGHGCSGPLSFIALRKNSVLSPK